MNFFLQRDDYINIAQTIYRANGVDASASRHIAEEHLGLNATKSFFFVHTDFMALINEAVDNPDNYIFARGNLTLIKDFPNNIGIYPAFQTFPKPTNRLHVVFSIERVLVQGRPWNGGAGRLVTAFPGNPPSQVVFPSQQGIRPNSQILPFSNPLSQSPYNFIMPVSTNQLSISHQAPLILVGQNPLSLPQSHQTISALPIFHSPSNPYIKNNPLPPPDPQINREKHSKSNQSSSEESSNKSSKKKIRKSKKSKKWKKSKKTKKPNKKK